MSEIKVTKENAIAKPEANEFFAPILPFGRFFGVRPFALMREFTRFKPAHLGLAGGADIEPDEDGGGLICGD